MKNGPCKARDTEGGGGGAQADGPIPPGPMLYLTRSRWRNQPTGVTKTMSRKHFKAIADAIRTAITDKAEREAIAKALIPALREANQNFNA